MEINEINVIANVLSGCRRIHLNTAAAMLQD